MAKRIENKSFEEKLLKEYGIKYNENKNMADPAKNRYIRDLTIKQAWPPVEVGEAELVGIMTTELMKNKDLEPVEIACCQGVFIIYLGGRIRTSRKSLYEALRAVTEEW